MNTYESELKRKLSAIENVVNKLDDINRDIVSMRYFDRYEIVEIASKVFMSRRAVYYRIDSAIKEMEYLIRNGYC